MYFVMKMIWLILFIYQMKNFKIAQIFCWYQTKVSHVMSISKILTDLCAIRQKIKIKSALVNTGCNVLVEKKSW